MGPMRDLIHEFSCALRHLVAKGLKLDTVVGKTMYKIQKVDNPLLVRDYCIAFTTFRHLTPFTHLHPSLKNQSTMSNHTILSLLFLNFFCHAYIFIIIPILLTSYHRVFYTYVYNTLHDNL